MPFQRRAALHHSKTSPSAPSGHLQAGSQLTPVVPGFRYLLRRSPVSPALGVALSLIAATLGTVLSATPAQARRTAHKAAKATATKTKATKTKIAKAPATPKPNGVWAWTSGSQTYVRARPGVQTPPVAKVPRHTKLFVWGRFTDWYRIETTDHKFGWIHKDCLNAPELEKAHEMSHFAAKKASDRTENQVMYGSVEMLKKHYERYGAVGAKKGLEEMGVRLTSTKRPAKTVAKVQPQPAEKVAAKVAPKAVAKAPVIEKPVVAKVAPKTAPKPVAKAAAKPPVKTQAVAQLNQTPVPVAETATAPETTPVVPVAAKLTGNPLHPSLPNPTVAAPAATAIPKIAVPVAAKPKQTTPKPAPKIAQKAAAQRLTPAIPFAPTMTRSAKTKSPVLPEITAEDLLRARQEHLRQKPATTETSPQETGNPLFVPSSYAPSTLPFNHFSPQAASKSVRPVTLDLRYARPATAETGTETSTEVANSSLSAPKVAPTAPKTLLAKNTAKPTAPKTTAAKPAAVSGPARGGSPRDLARIASAGAFGSNLATSALAYRGRPYVSGASSPRRGFDCSGLVYFLLRQRGKNPPRTAAGLAGYGKPVPTGQMQPGDIVLFANTYKRGVSHVGVYLGNNNFVHASTHSGGVRVDSLGSAYYCRKFYGARRVN